ncbi:hypothetical protein TgHK011_007165 [Trichoderma gracile]|nr:hypothetical protein TgHK011_007165 [Trichoderma gracile]
MCPSVSVPKLKADVEHDGSPGNQRRRSRSIEMKALELQREFTPGLLIRIQPRQTHELPKSPALRGWWRAMACDEARHWLAW